MSFYWLVLSVLFFQMISNIIQASKAAAFIHLLRFSHDQLSVKGRSPIAKSVDFFGIIFLK